MKLVLVGALLVAGSVVIVAEPWWSQALMEPVGSGTSRAEAAVQGGLGNPPGEPADPAASPPAQASTSECGMDLASCGYPDDTTTGPRTSDLERVPEDVESGEGWHYVDGGIIIDGDGTVLERVLTSASITIKASDVAVRDSVLETSGETWGIGLASGEHLTVVHNRIEGGDTDGPTRLLVGIKDLYGEVSDVSVIGNDISRTSTAVQLDAGLVQENYIHDLGQTGDDHVNGLTSNGGDEALVIRGNTILNQHPQTDAIGLFQDFGTQSNRWIVDNFIGGGGYTLYGGANPGSESGATEIHVIGNRFSSSFFASAGSYGPAAAWNPAGGNEWRSNTWDATGGDVPEP